MKTATLNDIQKKYGTSIYPLYKDTIHEPYIESDTGNGYQGVVLYDEKEDKIISHLSGKPIERINKSHLVKYGLNSLDEYREKFGLNKNVPLVNKKISQIQREVALKNIAEKKFHLGGTREMAFRASMAAKIKGVSSYSKKTTGYRNKSGLCDAQIESRLIIVKEIVGKREITTGDILKYDRKLYYAIYNYEGGIDGLAKRLKVTKSQAWGHKYEDASLLSLLRTYVMENKMLPKSQTQEVGLPEAQTFIKHFGSISKAFELAGLRQLLKEVRTSSSVKTMA